MYIISKPSSFYCSHLICMTSTKIDKQKEKSGRRKGRNVPSVFFPLLNALNYFAFYYKGNILGLFFFNSCLCLPFFSLYLCSYQMSFEKKLWIPSGLSCFFLLSNWGPNSGTHWYNSPRSLWVKLSSNIDISISYALGEAVITAEVQFALS